MNSKHCPHCHFTTAVIKYGTTSSSRQRYRCTSCGLTWTSKPHPQVLAKKIWHDLVFHNLNIKELSKKYGMCERTIRSKLDLYNPPLVLPDDNDRNTTVIAMDVTFFKRTGGILTVCEMYILVKHYMKQKLVVMRLSGTMRKPLLNLENMEYILKQP